MGWTLQWSSKLTNIHHLAILDLVNELNNATDDADVSMNDISKDETEERLRALANSKATGLDFIPVELLKWSDAMVLELTKTASMVWNTLKFPCEINCGAIIKLRKRRNLPEHEHWGVSLSW